MNQRDLKSARRWLKKAFPLCLAGCLALAGPVGAKDVRGLFTVKGVGVLDCAAYIEAAEAGDEQLAHFAGYVTGYVSAYNEQVAETYDLLPWQHIDTVMIVLLQRCQKDPARNFGLAVSEVATFFSDGRLKGIAGREVVGEGEAAVEMYGPVLRSLKRALVARGYLDAPDGDFTAAVRAAQADFGQEPTGVPDQATMLRLLHGAPAQATSEAAAAE
jgi:hypothetical protein